MIVADSHDPWYKNAILYCVDVGTFFDSNGDGFGDFEGLTSKLGYLADLGVTALWLLPFYPSPRKDGGYDVVDYYGVDPRFGSIGDFVALVRAAHNRGIRIVLDLVVQHTSSEHPWFRAARSSRESRYHSFYVWNSNPPPHRETELVFPGEQRALWTYVSEVGSFYRHRFYEHQPDLNVANPDVLREIAKVVDFWLQIGASGFRLDAAPFLLDSTGINSSQIQDNFSVLKELRRMISWRRGDAVLLAEANVPPTEAPLYFEQGHGVHMIINFWLNQYLFLALARQSAEPLQRAIRALPRLSPQNAWANFLRNHDELNLGRLSPSEREYVYSCFAPDPSARIYDRGIRRRLAAMLQDTRRVELAYSLLLSLPGTPILFYGDELGMGDDLSRPARLAVRTAMQWRNELNAGFSTVRSERLQQSIVSDGQFGYQHVNVAALERDPDSLFNRASRLIRTRKQFPEFGWGEIEPLHASNDSVFAHACRWGESRILAVHNLSSEPTECAIQLPLKTAVGQVNELAQNRKYAGVDSFNKIAIDGFGYRWFRLRQTSFV